MCHSRRAMTLHSHGWSLLSLTTLTPCGSQSFCDLYAVWLVKAAPTWARTASTVLICADQKKAETASHGSPKVVVHGNDRVWLQLLVQVCCSVPLLP